MNIAIIARSEKAHAVRRLIEACDRRGHNAVMLAWDKIQVRVTDAGLRIGTDDFDLGDFDAIIPRSDRYQVALNSDPLSTSYKHLFELLPEYARKRDIFFLNGDFYSSFQQYGKLAQQVFFSENRLPGIPTISARHAMKESDIPFPFPIIIKKNIGSLGKGVFKTESFTDAATLIAKLEKEGEPLILQRYIPINHDYRVLVVGGKVLGAIERTPQTGEWRTNISLGGVASPVIDPLVIKKLSEIAIETAGKMRLEYAGIDILEHNGSYLIIETNSLPQFKGFESAFPTTNVAEEMIAYVEKVTSMIQI